MHTISNTIPAQLSRAEIIEALRQMDGVLRQCLNRSEVEEVAELIQSGNLQKMIIQIDGSGLTVTVDRRVN